MMWTPNRVQTYLVIVAVGMGCAVMPVAASTVAPMTLAVMTDHTGQAIVGTVVSVRSYWADNPRRIESEVTFETVEYLKGALPDSTTSFRLIVPGGQMGETRMQVCCAPRFATGEKWLLFLLPSYKTFPVVGIYRGAFRIGVDDDGIECVLSADRKPVIGIDATGFVEIAGSRLTNLHRDPQQRVVDSRNVRVHRPANIKAADMKAMTYEAFVSTIQPILNRSKSHKLSGPAGRRVLVPYASTTLKRSPADRAADPVRSTPVPRGAGKPKEVEGFSEERRANR